MRWAMLKYAGDASDACSAALGEAGEAIDRRGGRHIHASDTCTQADLVPKQMLNIMYSVL